MNLKFSVFRRETEFPEQRALFSAAFPENAGLAPETEAFYLRKFRAFPAVPQAYEYVARDPEGMVGYYAAIPYTYFIDGEAFRCGMVCDVMTHPRMQGKGVFTKLGAYSLDQLTREGFDFVTGYPRRAAVIPGHLKVGWQIAFNLPLYILPWRTKALLASRKPWTGALAPAADLTLAAMRGLLHLIRPSKGGLRVRIWDWQAFLAAHDYEAFYQAWRSMRRNSLQKDETYLRWRLAFQGVPYHMVAAYDGERLIGLSILRSCTPDGVPALALMDIMAIEQEKSVLSALADGWRDLAKRTGDQVLLTMMSEHLAAKRMIWRLGFLRTPTVFHLIIKGLNERARARVLPDAAHWDLMWIDCDDL